MKAGAFTPATRVGAGFCPDAVGRSMKAGAFTPATPNGNWTGRRDSAALNEGVSAAMRSCPVAAM